MQRSEMRTMIRDLIQLDNTTELPDATIDMYLDEGYAEVAGYRNWEWANVATPIDVDTVAGTASYAVAAIERIVAVTDDTNTKSLKGVSWVDYLHLDANALTNSIPTHFAFWDGFLYLWPTPSSVLQLYAYYFATPSFGAGDTAEPDWEANFHYILVDWAMHRLWEREEDLDRSDSYRARFEAKLDRMVRYYNSHQELRPAIYGAGIRGGIPTNMPWLSDASNGGAS